jgi:hypothetical protein
MGANRGTKTPNARRHVPPPDAERPTPIGTQSSVPKGRAMKAQGAALGKSIARKILALKGRAKACASAPFQGSGMEATL